MSTTEAFLAAYVAPGQAEIPLKFLDDIEGCQKLNALLIHVWTGENWSRYHDQGLQFIG